jgi:hypothetical protein
MMPTVIVVTTTLVISVLKVFDVVYVMTNGNLGTDVIANRMYKEMFNYNDFGRASAFATLLLVAIIPVMFINIRRFGRLAGHQLVNRPLCAINQKHRAGLRVERLDVANAVVLLVGPGQLVFLDDPVEVILATRGRDQPNLAVPPHDLAVEVETGLRVLPESALGDKSPEILFSLRIDFGRVKVRGGWQIDFRLAHMEETQRVAGSQLAGLVGGHHVVRQFADPDGKFRLRAQRGKRFDSGHE